MTLYIIVPSNSIDNNLINLLICVPVDADAHKISFLSVFPSSLSEAWYIFESETSLDEN
jgi:hypothetical protein